jgi:hypothetical protein
MKLPGNIVIPERKLTNYLLTLRARNDKSGYLAQAGYELSNWELLQRDLTRLGFV